MKRLSLQLVLSTLLFVLVLCTPLFVRGQEPDESNGIGSIAPTPPDGYEQSSLSDNGSVNLQSSITNVNFRWDPNFTGGSIIVDRCTEGNYHWLTSEEISPKPRRLGSWPPWPGSTPPSSGCMSHYPVTNVLIGDIVEIGIGASTKNPGSGPYYEAPCTQFWRVKRTSSGLEWNRDPVRVIACNDTPTSVPTTKPTTVPTSVPTTKPTTVPTSVPTTKPTTVPTSVPTTKPTTVPTSVPITTPVPTTPELTRSRLYVDSRNYLVLEFCGKNINQNVYIGSKRSGRDFGIHVKRVTFGSTEQCTTDNNLADGKVLPGTTYYSGVSLAQQDVYNVCSSSKGLCDSIRTQTAIPVTPPPPPSGPCTVPFFWQSDPNAAWNQINVPTFGKCSCSIASCGCALTSLAMVFKYYGANVNPKTLSDCLGKDACGLVWGSRCSESKVKWVSWPTFSWSKLEAEVKKGPVILQANRSGGMHFVVVTGGSGSNANNYTINDPALKGGAGVKLSSLYGRGYHTFHSMRLFSGTPACQTMTTESLLSLNEVSDMSSSGAHPETNSLILSADPITGTVIIYQTTETTMTVELSAQSNSGEVTDMLIWTDTISNTEWQPYSSYTELLISNEVYVRFRDEDGNISETAMTPLIPYSSPSEKPYVSLESVSLSGPTTANVEDEVTFTATSGPETATLDVTYIWKITGKDTITQTNGLSDTMTLSWYTSGVKSVEVSASNGEETVSTSHKVTVESATLPLYLPLVAR